MTYKIDIDPEAREQIAALPKGASIALAEAMAMLELVPWNGKPYNQHKPVGSLRQVVFGAGGLVTYLILEDQQRVDVLQVVWMGAEP